MSDIVRISELTAGTLGPDSLFEFSQGPAGSYASRRATLPNIAEAIGTNLTLSGITTLATGHRFNLLDGVGVIPPNLSHGMAITQNFAGYGDIDFWNLTPGTPDGEGFAFHQKFGDGTEKTFFTTYWFPGGAELDLIFDLPANQFLNLAVVDTEAWFNFGDGVPKFAVYMDGAAALTLNSDLTAIIGGQANVGVVPASQPFGLAITQSFNNDNTVNLWNLYEMADGEPNGFRLLQKTTTIPGTKQLGAFYGGDTYLEVDLEAVAGGAYGLYLYTGTDKAEIRSWGPTDAASAKPLNIGAGNETLTLNPDQSAVFSGPITIGGYSTITDGFDITTASGDQGGFFSVDATELHLGAWGGIPLFFSLDNAPFPQGDVLRFYPTTGAAKFNGPVSQGAVNPNADYQGIASLSAAYNEIAVYGDYPATDHYVAISHSEDTGFLYTNGSTLVVGSMAYLSFQLSDVEQMSLSVAGLTCSVPVTFTGPVAGGNNGLAVLPVSTATAGWAISSNFQGFGEVDFWSTVNSTGDANQGFYFHQKTGATTSRRLTAMYGTSAWTEFDVVTPAEHILGLGSDDDRNEGFIYTDLASINIALVTSVPGYMPLSLGIHSLALSANFYGVAEIDFWNSLNSGAGFSWHQKKTATTQHELARIEPNGSYSSLILSSFGGPDQIYIGTGTNDSYIGTIPSSDASIRFWVGDVAITHRLYPGGGGRSYNLYTDDSNGEWAYLGDWSANVARYGTAMNGTGVARNVVIQRGGTNVISLVAGGVDIAGSLTSIGSASALAFQDRSTFLNWVWYATGGFSHLWNTTRGDITTTAVDGTTIFYGPNATQGVQIGNTASYARIGSLSTSGGLVLAPVDNGTNSVLRVLTAPNNIVIEAVDTTAIAAYKVLGLDGTYVNISPNLSVGTANGPVATLHVGATAATARTYNYYPSAANVELAYIGDWGGVANVARYGTDKAGTGVGRDSYFYWGGTEQFRVGNDAVSFYVPGGNPFIITPSTLRHGPAPTGNTGSMTIVRQSDGNGLVIARSVATPMELWLGVNQASFFAEIQGARGGVGVNQPLILNRQGGNVGIGTATPGSKLAIGGYYGSLASGWSDSSGAGAGYGVGGWGFNVVRTAATSAWVAGTDTAGNGGALIDATLFGNLRFFIVANTGGTAQTLTDTQMMASLAVTITAAGASFGTVGSILPPQANLTVGKASATARSYNTYADASNSEWAYMGDWSSNVVRYGTDKNGTGAVRDVSIVRGGLEHILLSAAGTTMSWQLNALGPLTVGSNNAGSAHRFNMFNDTALLLYSDTANEVVLEAVQASAPATKYYLNLNKYGGTVKTGGALYVPAIGGGSVISGYSGASYLWGIGRGAVSLNGVDIEANTDIGFRVGAGATPNSGTRKVNIASDGITLGVPTGVQMRLGGSNPALTVARTYNAYASPDTSNGEWAYFGDWVKTADVAVYGSDMNGSGVARNVSIVRGGTEAIRIGANGVGVGSQGNPLYLFDVNRNDSVVGASAVIRQVGTGDATLGFILPGVRFWGMGIDNSDGDTFKISASEDGFSSGGLLNITTGGLVGFAGTTIAFPALKRSGTELQNRLGDDSAFGPAAASVFAQAGNEFGGRLEFRSFSELTTIAITAFSVCINQIPANAVVLAVSARVVTAIPTATTFSVGVSGATTRYGTGISTAIDTTSPGTLAGPVYYAAQSAIQIAPSTNPATNVGRVRITCHYFLVTPPTS